MARKLKVPDSFSAPAGLGWQVFAFYLLAFAAGGVIQPFLNLYLSEVGLSGTQIGVIQGWTAFIAVVTTPLIGILADQTQRHRLILAVDTFIKGLAPPLMLISNAFPWLAAMVSMRVITAGVSDGLATPLTMVKLRQQSRSDDIGSIRFWGALSFAAASLGAGILARGKTVGIAFPLAAIFGTLAALSVRGFPERISLHHESTSPKRIWHRSEPMFVLFGVAFFCAFSMSGAETFANVYFVQSLGAGNDFIGLTGAVASLSMVAALYFSGRLLRSVGARHSMALSFILYILAWMGFSLTQHPFALIPFIASQAFGLGIYTVSLFKLLDVFGDVNRASTNQMLAQLSVPGIARIIAQPVSGWIFDAVGGASLFRFEAVLLALVTFFLITLGGRFFSYESINS
jgi:MFS family permease